MNSSRRCVFLVLSALAVTTCVALLIAGRVKAEEPDACTCSVTGRINLDDSCTSTRLEVWASVYGGPWTLESYGDYGDGDLFQLQVNGMECVDGVGRLRSNGHWITGAFDLPGLCDGTVALGSVYDTNTCSDPE